MHKTDSFPLRPTSGLLAPILFKKSVSMEQQNSAWYQSDNLEFTKSNSLSSSASEGTLSSFKTKINSTSLGNTGIKLTNYNLPSESPRRVHHVEPLNQKTFTPALSPAGEPSDSIYHSVENTSDPMELRQNLSNLDKETIINLFISSKLHAKQYKDVQKAVTSISIADSIENILESYFRYSKQILKCQEIKFYVPNPDNSSSIIDYLTKQTVPYDEGIIGEVLKNSSSKMVENVQSKSQYRDYEDNNKVNTILCVPAYDYKQRLICIGKAINKSNNISFNEEDERSFLILLLTTGNNFKRAMLLERLKSAQESTTSALKITQVLSSSINYEEIIRDIINITKEIVQCKFFRLLLVEGSELVDYTSNFRKSIEGSLSGQCIKTSHVITIGDFSNIKPEKLAKEIDTIQPNELVNLLCVPILDQDNHNPIAVLEAYNHICGNFTKEEENLLQYIADTASVQFHHSKLHKQAMVQEKMNRGLVQIMKIVSQTDDKDDIFTSLNKLVEIGYDGVECERITVFLLDANTHTLHSKVSRDLDPNYHLPLNNSIAGCCIASKQTINISNAYNDQRFNKAFDKETGFQTKSIIALCLTDVSGNPIGVLEAVNKKGIHQRFDDDDILLLNTLATEISNFLRKRAMELAYEVHSLHSNNQSSKFIQSLLSQYSEVTTPISPQPVLSTTTLIPKQVSLMNHSNEIANKIENWDFNSLEYEPDQLFPFIKYCFDSYDLFHQWNIDQNKFYNFIKVVQSNYFDNPYHNYFHAMGVFHICYMFLRKAEAVKGITAIDTLALLLSAIVHDIDHPGHNNDYEIKLGSTLSILYNDQSVLENHHCALTFQLMRDNNCALLSSLSYNDYRLLRKGMIQAILATDMVHHNEYIKYVEDFVPKPTSSVLSNNNNINNNNSKNIDEEESRKLIATIIHAADLSNPVVPSFDVCKDWSKRICTEFANQFNHEKENHLPISYHMDIDVNNDSAVATFQLSFIDYVIRPLWNPLVTKIYPLANELIGYLNNNYSRWKELSSKNNTSTDTTDSKSNK